MKFKKEIGRGKVLLTSKELGLPSEQFAGTCVCCRIQLSGRKKTISEIIEALTNNQRRHIVNLQAPAQRTLGTVDDREGRKILRAKVEHKIPPRCTIRVPSQCNPHGGGV